MMGVNDNITTSTEAGGQIFLDDAFNGIANRDRNLWRVDNYVKAAIDDPITGILNLGAMAVNTATLGLTDFEAPESIMPDSFQTYHRNEDFYRGVTGLAGAFYVGGAAMKSIREGGRVAELLRTSKLPGSVVGAITSNTASVNKAEEAIGQLRVGMAKTFSEATGMNTPLDFGAEALSEASSLRSWGRTLNDAEASVMKARTWNGVKESLAAEAAVYGLYNQNDFLFPEDTSLWSNVVMIGGGVGLGVFGERLAGNVARRKTMQAAARTASIEAQNARSIGKMFTLGDTIGTIGNEWQPVMARVYEDTRLERLFQNADAVAAGSDSMTAGMIRTNVDRIRANNATEISNSLNRMATSRSAADVLAGKTHGIIAEAVSRTQPKLNEKELGLLQEIVRNNNRTGVALSFLEDAEVVARYTTVRMKLEDKVLAAQKAQVAAGDDVAASMAAAADLARAKNSLADLEAYIPGVIERSGSVNYNPSRFAGQLGAEVNAGLKVRTGAASDILQFDGVRAVNDFDIGNGQMANTNRTIQMNRYGQLTVQSNRFGNGTVLKETELTPNEITQLQSLVGRATDGSETTKKFWDNFWTSFSASAGDATELPFPVLDALVEGRLKVPANISPTPAVLKLQQQVSDESLRAIALGKKMDYMREHPTAFGTATAFDAHDYEKLLNLRLTNDAGQPNNVMQVLDAWRKTAGPNTRALDFLAKQPGSVNDKLDALVQLANSNLVQGGRVMSVDDFYTDLNSMLRSNLTAHTDRNGFGAIYTRVAEPTDTEFAVARIADARNRMQQGIIQRSQNPMIASVSRALQSDELALSQASDIASLAVLDAKNNLVTTTDFSLRGERAIRGAINVGKRVKQAYDSYVDQRVGQIASGFQKLFKENDIDTRASILEWQNLARSGIPLRDAAMVAGRNEIDISTPGAKRLLERLGPLEGAPAKGQPWHAFSMARAVNDRKYVPIEFSERSAGYLNEIFGFQYEALEAENVLNSHAGKRLINKFNGHMPVDDQRRFFRAYAIDQNGNMFYVKGRTQREADAELDQIMRDENARFSAAGEQNLYRQITEDQIAAYKEPLDQLFLHRMADWSGIKQTGTAAGRFADPRIDLSTDNFDSMLLSMRQLADDIRERTTVAAMAPAFSEANRINALIKNNGMMTENGRRVKGAFTAIDNWQNILLSRDQLPEASMARKVHATIEGLYNNAVSGIDSAMQTIPLDTSLAMMDRVFGAGVAKARGALGMPAKPAFDAADALLKNYAPMAGVLADENLVKYLKLKNSVDSYKLSKQLQNFNKVTTRAFLSFANIAHPILNFMGIGATLPAVVRQVQRMPGESNEAWMARGGGMFDYIDPERGEATINPVKLMIEALHIMHNDPSAYRKAKELGYLDANMLEGLYEHSKLRPNNFDDALEWGAKYLDIYNTPFKAGYKRIKGKEFDYQDLSEWSEIQARAISHMAGLAIMRRSGRPDLSEEEMHTFAHWFANQNIADFSPNLRGQAFRGVAGIPLGLFQSYGINILQRMFGYIEDRNMRTLATQLGTQWMMFGGQSLPGWPALNAYYFHNTDAKASEHGATSLNERIYDGVGKFWGDVLLTGVPSNITQMLGGSSGINMYTSGDVNPRNPFSLPPAASMIQQVGAGLFEALKTASEEAQNVKDGLGFEPGRFIEILSNYAPARGYRSLADLMLGEHVDRNGNISQEDTRWGVAGISRLLGMRTSDETKRSAAIWENSQAQSQRIGDMTAVRDMMLRRIDENGQLSDSDLQVFYRRYLTVGGTERGWKNWLKTTMEKTQYSRGDRRLDDLVTKDGFIYDHNLAAAQRLFYAGVVPGNTDKTANVLK